MQIPNNSFYTDYTEFIKDDSSREEEEIGNRKAIEDAPEEFKNFRPETKEQFIEKTVAFFQYRDPEGEYVTGRSTGHDVIENKRDRCSIPIDGAWVHYEKKKNMPFVEAAEIIYEQFREISNAAAMEFTVRGMPVPGVSTTAAVSPADEKQEAGDKASDAETGEYTEIEY